MRILAPFLAVALATLASFPFTAFAQGTTCTDCGTLQSMRYVEEKGQASGVGAVAAVLPRPLPIWWPSTPPTTPPATAPTPLAWPFSST